MVSNTSSDIIIYIYDVFSKLYLLLKHNSPFLTSVRHKHRTDVQIWFTDLSVINLKLNSQKMDEQAKLFGLVYFCNISLYQIVSIFNFTFYKKEVKPNIPNFV